ncbi:MAG: hypothetical protein Q4A41_06650 [Bacillota bacterium]|nr:hypothetical protein [Bacillota bacterium]
MIDIYLLSTLLFAALVFIRGKNPLKNGAAFSVAVLVIATALRHHYSDFSVVKLAFILYTFSLPTEHLNNKNHEQLIGSAHFFMLTASLFVVFNQLLSAVFLTIVLLVLACASLFIDIAKREKERIQAEIILLCGIFVTIVSSSFYNQYFGIFIMCVHLALRVMLILKAKKIEEEETEKRLEQLENSFHRQLRQETRKISRGLENRVEEIEEKSMRDPLTKVLNRSPSP